MANDEITGRNVEEEETVRGDETGAQRFSRIGSMRLQKVLDAMRVLRNCASPGYEYTPEQVAKIDSLIMGEHAKTMAAFRGERIVEKQPNLL